MALLDEIIAPTEGEAELAKESSRQLAPHGKRNLKLSLSANGDEIELPASVVRLLIRILTEMSAGNAISLIPIHAELTTQEAADLLNISRPYLIGLLRDGMIPHRKVGTHRRILFSDLMKYKEQSDVSRRQALDALVQEGQDLGMGY